MKLKSIWKYSSIFVISILIITISISSKAYASNNNLYAQWSCNSNTISLPFVTPKTGYTFNGWKSGDTSVTSVSNKYTALKADFTPITYSITYDYAGGSATVNPATYTVEDSISLNAPTRSGYKFTGWTGSNTAGVINKGTTGDLSFTASWTPNTYIVTFDTDIGSSIIEPKTVAYDSAYGNLETPSCKGNTFDGWYTSNGTKINASDIYKQLGNQTLHARWHMIRYTITYNYAGGSGSNPDCYYYQDTSSLLRLNAPTRSGYVFTGWTGSNGATPQTEVYISYRGECNLSFTANWKPDIKWTGSSIQLYTACGGSATGTGFACNVYGCTDQSSYAYNQCNFVLYGPFHSQSTLDKCCKLYRSNDPYSYIPLGRFVNVFRYSNGCVVVQYRISEKTGSGTFGSGSDYSDDPSRPVTESKDRLYWALVPVS